jgi:hypothetical protein
MLLVVRFPEMSRDLRLVKPFLNPSAESYIHMYFQSKFEFKQIKNKGLGIGIDESCVYLCK